MTTITGKWALITGASSGLGVDFARELAARGANIILAARRLDRLESVREAIGKLHAVQIETMQVDLAAPDAPQTLHDQLEAGGRPIDMLINNAGLGIYGPFLEIEWAREKAMLELDIVTLTHMSKLFLRGMVARRFGYVMQIASIGAYQPSPLYASYSAAKAYVMNFSLAVNHELAGTGVKMCVVSPGVTRTEFLEVAGQAATPFQRMTRMESPAVARIGVEGMLAGRTHIVPGWINQLLASSTRLMPRGMAAAIASRSMH